MYFHYDDLTSRVPPMREDDKTKIRLFLEDVQDFLARLVKHRAAFIDALYDDVVQAWGAASMRFGQAIAKVSQISESKLEQSGLTGPELKLKLRNVEHSFGQVLLQAGGPALLKLFDTIDSLLQSVADALGVGTALQEIKDAIKGALVWARN